MARTRPQRIQEHGAWTDLDALDQLLADAKPLLAEEPPENTFAYTSLLALAKYTRTVLKSLNPVLVPETQLEEVDRTIQAISNSVTAAIQQGDAAQLTTAWSQADPLLKAVAILPVVKSRHDVSGVTAAIDQFHQHLGELFDDVEERTEGLSTKVDKLNQRRAEIASDISTQKAALDTAMSGFQEQFAAEQEKQDADYTAALEAVQAKLGAAAEKGEEFYTEDEAQHQEQRERFDTEFEALRSEINAAAKAAAKSNAARAETVIAELQQHLEKANELVGMIGEEAMRGHYGRNANEQKKEADKWRWATVAASIAAVVSAGVLLWYGLSHRADRDWIDYASRFGVTVALIGLATYLGAQARIHRQFESKFRLLELELAVLDPFLSTMSEKERHNIKTQLASKYFVGADPEAVPLNNLDDEPT